MSTPAPPFTRAVFMLAFNRALPMALGIFIYGAAFGIMAVQAKFSIAQATLMSALMFSGSAQLASVGVLTAGFSSILAVASTLFLTILVMNARYFLYGATLYPVMAGTPPFKAYGSLFMLGDGAWLMTMKAHEEGNRDTAYLLGCSVGVYAAWVFGTLAGAFASNLASDPKKLGLDFFLVAFAAAMFGGMFKAGVSSSEVVPGSREESTTKQMDTGKLRSRLIGIFSKGDFPTVLIAVPVALLAEPHLGFGGSLVLAGLAGGVSAFFKPIKASA